MPIFYILYKNNDIFFKNKLFYVFLLLTGSIGYIIYLFVENYLINKHKTNNLNKNNFNNIVYKTLEDILILNYTTIETKDLLSKYREYIFIFTKYKYNKEFSYNGDLLNKLNNIYTIQSDFINRVVVNIKTNNYSEEQLKVISEKTKQLIIVSYEIQDNIIKTYLDREVSISKVNFDILNEKLEYNLEQLNNLKNIYEEYYELEGK